MDRNEIFTRVQGVAYDQVERARRGEPVCDVTTSDGARVVVTKSMMKDQKGNDSSMYEYMIYYPYKSSPYCYIESPELFTDFEKTTSVEGNALPYSGPQSVLVRNLTGVFKEYVHTDMNNGNFHTYTVYIKAKPTDKVKWGAGYTQYMHKTDPVPLVLVDFVDHDIVRTAGLYTSSFGGEERIVADLFHIKPDGSLDIEGKVKEVEGQIEAMGALGEIPILSRGKTKEMARETVKERMDNFGKIPALASSIITGGIPVQDNSTATQGRPIEDPE